MRCEDCHLLHANTISHPQGSFGTCDVVHCIQRANPVFLLLQFLREPLFFNLDVVGEFLLNSVRDLRRPIERESQFGGQAPSKREIVVDIAPVLREDVGARSEHAGKDVEYLLAVLR